VTVLDIITRAMRLINAIDAGGSPEADEAQTALDALNSLTDAWGSERLTSYASARNIYPLVTGQQVYQIGPNAPDWVGPRPARLLRAGLIIPNSDPTEALERPIHILKTEAEYARIRVKGLQSTLPTKIYFDHWYNNPDPQGAVSNVGSANVYLWPCPIQAGLSVALYVPLLLAQFANLTQTISLPPGYARALVYNLALEIAPEFSAQPSPVVAGIADESLRKLKAANFRVNKMRGDLGRRGGFDYLTGEIR